MGERHQQTFAELVSEYHVVYISFVRIICPHIVENLMKRKKLDFPQSILLQAGKLSDLKKKPYCAASLTHSRNCTDIVNVYEQCARVVWHCSCFFIAVRKAGCVQMQWKHSLGHDFISQIVSISLGRRRLSILAALAILADSIQNTTTTTPKRA